MPVDGLRRCPLFAFGCEFGASDTHSLSSSECRSARDGHAADLERLSFVSGKPSRRHATGFFPYTSILSIFLCGRVRQPGDGIHD